MPMLLQLIRADCGISLAPQSLTSRLAEPPMEISLIAVSDFKQYFSFKQKQKKSQNSCAVLIYDIYDMHSTPFSSYNGYKLNSHLICLRRGFIAQSVEHRTSTAEVMGSNPVEASEFFLGFICNCLSYFTTAKVTFTSIKYRCLNRFLTCSLFPNNQNRQISMFSGRQNVQ